MQHTQLLFSCCANRTCACSTSVALWVRTTSSTLYAACRLLGLWLLAATSSGYINAWGWCLPIRTSKLWIRLRTYNMDRPYAVLLDTRG